MAVDRIEHFKKRSLDLLHDINQSVEANTLATTEQSNGHALTTSTLVHNHQQNQSYEVEPNPNSPFIKDSSLEEVLWKGEYGGDLAR